MEDINKKALISIKAVGDICPGDQSILGMGILNKTKEHGADFPFLKIRDLLKGSDLVLGNLEGLLSSKVTDAGGRDVTFCGLPKFAEAMARAGFNVINVANNHILEHGPEFFHDTVNILKRAGLEICGMRSDGEKYYSEPVVLNIRDRVVGILGYNWVGVDNFQDADLYIAQSHDSIVNYTWERDNNTKLKPSEANRFVTSDIKQLRKEVDLLILMPHWGFEYVNIPPYRLTLEARHFIDSGVNIVIGSHPHTLQGMERYNGGIIFYSLGNFIFDSHRKLTRSSAILDVSVGEGKEIFYSFKSCFINSCFQPDRVNHRQNNYINSIIDKSNELLSSPNKVVILDDDKLYRKYEHFYNVSKLYSIINHFIAIRKNPFVIKLIFKKGINFVKILLARIKGQKIRW